MDEKRRQREGKGMTADGKRRKARRGERIRGEVSGGKVRKATVGEKKGEERTRD